MEAAPQRQRREFALLPVLGVLVLTAAALGYHFKDEILARFGDETPPPATAGAGSSSGTPVPEGPEPGSEAAGQRGEESALTDPAPAASEPPQTGATPPEAAPAVEPEPSPPPTASVPPPPPAPMPTAAPSPAAAPPASAAVDAGGELTRLLDISWEEAGGGLQVTLTGDGAIPTGRYRYFHLAGDAPREVVKLMGVSQGFRQSQLTVGGPGVRRIRTGFHKVQGGNEQHVVIDLLGPRWKITEVQSVGSALLLTIAEE